MPGVGGNEKKETEFLNCLILSHFFITEKYFSHAEHFKECYIKYNTFVLLALNFKK